MLYIQELWLLAIVHGCDGGHTILPLNQKEPKLEIVTVERAHPFNKIIAAGENSLAFRDSSEDDRDILAERHVRPQTSWGEQEDRDKCE